jgi:hypothetical protein
VPEGVEPADCTGHRHATFAVAVPDADGNLQRLDLGAPQDGQGHAYYQLGVAPRMTVAVHMHQAGPEAGSPELQVSQMHYESNDDCATVAESLHVIDVEASASRLEVAGKHAFKGTWTAQGADQVRVYLQVPATANGVCTWQWAGKEAASGLAHVVGNGESFLVLFGDPAPGNLALLQDGIPAPTGRPSPDCA